MMSSAGSSANTNAERKIAVLTVLSPHAWIIINCLAERFGSVVVINEDRQSRQELLRRRMRKQGVLTVLGQALFVLFQKLPNPRRDRRIREIVETRKLNVAPRADCPVIAVSSVNGENPMAAIRQYSPAAVIVLGTRIITRSTREKFKVPLVNVHAGITPKYRGQAGGYWVLASDDAENAGITVHLIDDGVDTGPVLYEAKFDATPADSFNTYFYLQHDAARAIAVKAVEDALNGTIRGHTVDLPSQQFYHPMLWGYLKTALLKNVW